MSLFVPADILIPKVLEMEKWSVIACDQFTSQPEYWKRTEKLVGDAPSSLKLIYPEAELSEAGIDSRISLKIKTEMERYLEKKLFMEYQHSFVYTERRLHDGMIRRGLVGAVDLKHYDHTALAGMEICSTEETVLERIPPRKTIREQASLELPHLLLFADDEKQILWEYLEQIKMEFPLLYDLELMEGGGHLTGRYIGGEQAVLVQKKIEEYEKDLRERRECLGLSPILYATADGNHSLAAAKEFYEELSQKSCGDDHPARYALAELINIHDKAQKFYPIHRIVKHTDPRDLQACLEKECGRNRGIPVKWYQKGAQGEIFLDPEKDAPAVEILDGFLERYLSVHEGEVDYIHGRKALLGLSEEEHAIGFELPMIEKEGFFEKIAANGPFPRKTFSLGYAEDKRYYLEARKIR